MCSASSSLSVVNNRYVINNINYFYPTPDKVILMKRGEDHPKDTSFPSLENGMKNSNHEIESLVLRYSYLWTIVYSITYYIFQVCRKVFLRCSRQESRVRRPVCGYIQISQNQIRMYKCLLRYLTFKNLIKISNFQKLQTAKR